MLSCPVCAGELAGTIVQPLMAYVCAPCGAIWLSNRAGHTALKRYNPGLLRLAVQVAENARTPSRDAGQTRACAECREAMRVTPMWNERVVIDVCDEHGTFFDPGELRKVLEERVRPPAFSHTSDEELEAFRHELRAMEVDGDGELSPEEADSFLSWVFGTLLDAYRRDR
jgi:Zn-finger nucleic acid-binding protein